MLPSPKDMRTGLLFFSLMMRDTRSMTDMISARSTWITVRNISGMERR